MSRKTDDMLAVVAHFLDLDWIPRHLTLGMLNCDKGTKGSEVARKLAPLLNKYTLPSMVLCTVKDQGANLVTTMQVLEEGATSRTHCKALGVESPWRGDCLAHAVNGAMNKGCTSLVAEPKKSTNAVTEEDHESDEESNYGTGSAPQRGFTVRSNNARNVKLKAVLSKMQSCITWSKKSSVGWRCMEQSAKALQKPKVVKFVTPVKTRFVTRFKMIDSLLAQRAIVDHCYKNVAPEKYRNRAPTSIEWAAAEQFHQVLEYPSKVVVKSEDKSHWYLCDAANRLVELEDHMLQLLETPDSFVIKLSGSLAGDEGLHESLAELVGRLSKVIAESLAKYVDCFRAFSATSPQMPLAVLLDPRQRGGPFIIANRGDQEKAVQVLHQYADFLISLAIKGDKFCDSLKARSASASATSVAAEDARANPFRQVQNLFSSSAFRSSAVQRSDSEQQAKDMAKRELD
eukprot:scaffold177760_cov21-Prasinocladus_malaysianus.AAC.1